MSKPTLVQKALNRPSQTYGNIETRPKKDYYSTKQDMIRIAAAAAASNTHTTASTKLARAIYYPSPQYKHVDDDDEDDGDSDLEVFFTPNTSPRTSMASAGSAATITFGGGATRKPSRRSLTNVTSAESHLPMVLPLPEQSTSTVKSHTHTEVQTSGSVPSTRTPSRSASTSTRTPSTSSRATVSRSASTSTQTRNRHAASSSSLSSTSLDAHSVISSEDAELVVDQSATPKAKDKARERMSHGTPTSQRRDEERDRRQATHQSSTSTSVSNATRPSTDGIGSSTTMTIVIGSSRDAHNHGKGKEREKERNFASASASTTTPIPSTTSSTSTPTSTKHNSISYTNSGTTGSAETGTGTISISSRTKYVPPTSSSSGRSGSSKTPHTFSAFAAIGSSSTSTGSSPGSSSTSTPVSSPPHDHSHTSRSTSTPTSSSSTTTSPPHSLSRKGHIQIGEKKAGEVAFSTTTPKTPSNTTSPKGTNSSANASPSTKTSINSSKMSTLSKIPIPTNTTGGQAGHKNRLASPSTRSPDANGHARNSSTSSPPSSFPHSSLSSPPSSTSPPSTVHRKAPPPVLPPLPISYPTQPQNNNSTPIQKPGSGQSGLMAMFGMDALMEEEEEEEDLYEREGDDPDEEEGRSTPRMYSRGQSRAYGSSSSGDGNTSTSGHTRRAPPKTLSAEVTSLQQTFTSPGERPSKGTQGYTSLVLPRAPPPSSSNIYTNGIGGKHPKMQVKASRDGTSGKVDLTKSGVAQTTMASVEVVRGLGERARGKGVFGLLRFGFGGGGKGREKERPRGPMPIHIPAAAEGGTTNGSAQGDTGNTADPSVGIDPASGVNATPHTSNTSPNTTSITPLGFTAYRAPPSYVPSGSVLVQVWAVGVDGVDGRLVGVRFGSGGGSGVGLHNGGNETEEEGQTEEETEGEAGGDETELDYETEREGHLPQSSTDDEDGEENILSTQSTPARPTQPKVGGIAPRTSPQHAKKGRLAALGRSFSLRLAKGANSADAGPGNDKVGVQRSASAAVSSSKPKAGVNGGANDSPSHKRALSFSLKRSNTAVSRATNGTGGSSEKNASSSQSRSKSTGKRRKPPKQSQAAVGYIPGRSFVGRVLECGWEVRDEVVRKGEWVVGLLDVRKAGALAEFIVVDRHRVHRVPQPQSGPTSNPVWAMSPTAPPSSPTSPFSSQRSAASAQSNPPPTLTLTLEELALLPLCGLSAYRAVRTFSFAFSSSRDGGRGGPSAVDRKSLDFVGGNYAHGHGPKQSSVDANKADDIMADHGHDPRHGYRRRALVLRGHDGVGAMAVQMLARRGWLVSVHVPCSALPHDASQAEIDRFMQLTEERARTWGADEIIHDDSSPMGGVPASGAINENGEWEPQGQGADDGRGAAVRLMDMIREDGDVFDAILDTVGGKVVREAGERLLRFQGPVGGINGAAGAVTRNGIPVFKRRGVGQFTTTVGDVPERVVPSAGDNFKAGLRSLRLGGTTAYANTHSYSSEPHSQAAPATPGVEDRPTPRGSTEGKGKGKVGYAWVSVAQDVDWEGDDVSETLGAVVRMALEDGVRPVVEDMRDLEIVEGGAESGKDLAPSRVVPFEHAPKVFVDNGPLRDGGTVVVRIADY